MFNFIFRGKDREIENLKIKVGVLEENGDKLFAECLSLGEKLIENKKKILSDEELIEYLILQRSNECGEIDLSSLDFGNKVLKLGSVELNIVDNSDEKLKEIIESHKLTFKEGKKC